MGEMLRLNFKLMTGGKETLEISENSTVWETKEKLHANKQCDAPPYRQKMRLESGGSPLEDDRRLSSYTDIKSGANIYLIIQPPWVVYIDDPENGKTYEIEIPSKDPQSYKISDFKVLYEKASGRKLDLGHQFQLQEKSVNEKCDGKDLTLKDIGIGKEDTVTVMKTGKSLSIDSPEVDVCFMVDCTGSMGSWIESVKKNIKSVRDSLVDKYPGCQLKFGFVRYTDYDQPEHSRTTWLDFTDSLSQFNTFVDPIQAGGGGDGPEDVMGGLKVSLSKLNWQTSSAKVLIHIADAPCHGSQYHTGSDNYPKGDPAGISHEEMMNQVVHLNIQYWFGYINRSSTDQMIGIFNDYLKKKSDQRLIIRQVDATDPEELASTVQKSVTASVFANEARK